MLTTEDEDRVISLAHLWALYAHVSKGDGFTMWHLEKINIAKMNRNLTIPGKKLTCYEYFSLMQQSEPHPQKWVRFLVKTHSALNI